MDFLHLERYKENNRIEAKRARGGFPQSIWETYSAFANTLGGVILLGVEEMPDQSLRAVGLPDAQKTSETFWEGVNDSLEVSRNILTRKRVEIKKVDGKSIVVITVPQAKKSQKPVYIGGDPFSGTYQRRGEGDYKCERAEVESMLREAEKAKKLPIR